MKDCVCISSTSCQFGYLILFADLQQSTQLSMLGSFPQGSLLLGPSTAVFPHSFRPTADSKYILDMIHYPLWFPYIL